MAATRHVPADWDKAVRRLVELNTLMKKNQQLALKTSAIYARDQMKSTILDGLEDWPELKPATIRRKRSSKILVDFGDLVGGISETVKKGLAFVGILRTAKATKRQAASAASDSSAEKSSEAGASEAPELVDIGAVHEYGSEKRNIPERSFVRTTFNRIKDTIGGIHTRAAEATLKGQVFRAG